MFFFLLVLLHSFRSDEVIQVKHFTTLKYKAFPAEIKQIFPIGIEDSFDTSLKYKGTGAQPCRAVQLSLQFHTHTMTLISD